MLKIIIGILKLPNVSRKFNFIRIVDIILSSSGLLLLSPVFILVYILSLFDTGKPIFRQERVGLYKRPFILVKFRTMSVGTASVASHLSSNSSITTLGHFLRRTKLDELPQLWNVLKGEMSLVGPRPGLYNQLDLMEVRDKYGIFSVRPGITGLSQINRVDMSEPEKLAIMDAKMISDYSFSNYLKYILLTVYGRGAGDGIK